MTKKPPAKRPRGRPPAEEPLKKRMIRATDKQWAAWAAASGGNRCRWIRENNDRTAKRKLRG